MEAEQVHPLRPYTQGSEVMTPTLTTFNDIAPRIEAYHANPSAYKGKSTGSRKLDELITLKEGNLHIITGIPSSGKSELLDQIMLNTVALHDWHWSVFSPENWPLEAHFAKMCEKWVGRPWSGQGHVGQVSPREIKQAQYALSDNITFLDKAEGMMDLDTLLEACKLAHERKKEFDKKGISALLLDPWNEISANLPKGTNETNYIGECLSKLRNFGRKNEIGIFIVAHPTKLQKNEDQTYPVPTGYDVAGSANWRNKSDAMLSVWRDYAENDGVVQVHVQKVRNKMLGKLGMVELHWSWASGLFCEEPTAVGEAHRYAIGKRVMNECEMEG